MMRHFSGTLRWQVLRPSVQQPHLVRHPLEDPRLRPDPQYHHHPRRLRALVAILVATHLMRIPVIPREMEIPTELLDRVADRTDVPDATLIPIRRIRGARTRTPDGILSARIITCPVRFSPESRNRNGMVPIQLGEPSGKNGKPILSLYKGSYDPSTKCGFSLGYSQRSGRRPARPLWSETSGITTRLWTFCKVTTPISPTTGHSERSGQKSCPTARTMSSSSIGTTNGIVSVSNATLLTKNGWNNSTAACTTRTTSPGT